MSFSLFFISGINGLDFLGVLSGLGSPLLVEIGEREASLWICFILFKFSLENERRITISFTF